MPVHPPSRSPWATALLVAVATAAAIGLMALPLTAADPVIRSDQPYAVSFDAENAKFVRVVIFATGSGNQPCIDELEVYGPDGEANLALAETGAVPGASSCLGGYAAHAVEHLNDGRYGNPYSWIAATTAEEWAQVELPEPGSVDRVVISRDRERRYGDRVPTAFEVRLSLDSREWKTVRRIEAQAISGALPGREGSAPALPAPPPPPTVADGRLTAGPSADTLAAPREDERGFENLALRPTTTPSASSVYADGALEIHQIAHLNDGLSGNEHSWIAKSAGPEWAQLDLGSPFFIYKVALGNDNAGRYSDRAATHFSVQLDEAGTDEWRTVLERKGASLLAREAFTFKPVRARRARVLLESASSAPRIDEFEIYGREERITADEIGPIDPPSQLDGALRGEELLRYAFLAEEHAWVKTYGRADLSSRLVPYNGRVKEYPRHVGDDRLPLPPMANAPTLDGRIDDEEWHGASRGVVRVAWPYDFDLGPLVEHELHAARIGDDLALAIRTDRLISSHLAVLSTADWQGCGIVVVSEDGLAFRALDDDGQLGEPLPLEGACDESLTSFELRLPLKWFPQCADYGLRIGLGLGGRHTLPEGRGISLALSDLSIGEAGPCRSGRFTLRVGLAASAAEGMTVRLPAETISLQPGDERSVALQADVGPIGPELNLQLTDSAGQSHELHLFRYDPLQRTLTLMAGLVERFAASGLDTAGERAALREFLSAQQRLMAEAPDREAERAAFFEARAAKRNLFMREPALEALGSLLFVKRHAYHPSHIYTDYTDAPFRPGGGIYTLSIPRRDGRLAPDGAELTELYRAQGVPRDPVADFGLDRIYFGHRPTADGFYHLMAMDADGANLTQLTDGPFHDFYPCPLPDGDIAFITTRCTSRVFCFRWTSSTLHRMAPDGSDLRPVSHSSLSEWAPSVMGDGRLIWTRWEYLDKGADFSQTLWSVHPDGTAPELVFGNTIIQPNGYANGREVPGTQEISCTLVSHFGDINGPIVLLDLSRGRMNPEAITSLTPEVPWPGMWPMNECFRDPLPIARDYFLCSHAPRDQFGLYVIGRHGNREALYLDPSIGSMGPTLFRKEPRPPVLVDTVVAEAEDEGRLVLMDVYAGIDHIVPRGSVKYLRVVEEVRHNLEAQPNLDHSDFQKWYASPVDVVTGPSGWPAYTAKASLGLVPVEEDGSAHFTAPAGRNFYFQALDEDFNELQRMRSLVHLQPGEQRTCVGCHEGRNEAPSSRVPLAAQRPPSPIEPPSFGDGPFSFEQVVQPVLDANCISCHNAEDAQGIDLTATYDQERIPQSYRTLISRGLVHFVDCGWNSGGCEKVEPMTFGTLKSKLFQVLDAGHYDIALTRDETLRIKTWIDLNCPLWPDYIERSQRPMPPQHVTRAD